MMYYKAFFKIAIVWLIGISVSSFAHGQDTMKNSQSTQSSMIMQPDSEVLDFPVHIDLRLEETLIHRVHFLDQFIERFNGTQSLPSRSLLNDTSIHRRVRQLASLFDDPALKDTMMAYEFISHMVDSSIFIALNDSRWLTSIDASVRFEGEIYPIRLGLRLEAYPEGYRKWNIYSVKADFTLNWMSKGKRDMAYFSELSSTDWFRSVQDSLQRNIGRATDFVSQSFRYDEMTAFLVLARLNQIEFIAIEDVALHFFQLPGWRMEVKEIRKESPRSGWLIQQIVKSDELQKQAFLDHYFSIY